MEKILKRFHDSTGKKTFKKIPWFYCDVEGWPSGVKYDSAGWTSAELDKIEHNLDLIEFKYTMNRRNIKSNILDEPENTLGKYNVENLKESIENDLDISDLNCIDYGAVKSHLGRFREIIDSEMYSDDVDCLQLYREIEGVARRQLGIDGSFPDFLTVTLRTGHLV